MAIQRPQQAGRLVQRRSATVPISQEGGVSAFRKAMRNVPKEEIIQRISNAYETKKDSGKYKIYLKDLRNPLWKPKNGIHIIDHIPFLSGGLDPDKGIKKGDITYRVLVYVHSKVGCTEDRVICPARTYQRPCPICEYISTQYSQSDPEKIDVKYLKSLDAKKRVLYNVLIQGKDAPADVHIFEVSHFLYDIELSTIALNKRTGTFYPFYDPDEGMSIGFEKIGEGVNTKYKGFERIEREAPISDEILNQAAIIDLHLEVLPYKELKDKFYDNVSEDNSDGIEEDVADFEDIDGDDGLPIADEIEEDDIPY